MSYILKTNYADKSNYGSYRNTSKIKYIVWHFTANDGDTDESNAKYFKRKNIKASAHYFVDDDSITISVPDTYVAWSVGGSRYSDYKLTGGASLYKICTNTNSISIELCDTIKDGKYNASEKTIENAIELTRKLMKKYNIPIQNVIRHFDVTGKKCPLYLVNNTEWNKVKKRISLSSITSKSNTTSYSKLQFIKDIQKSINVKVDGVVGKETISKLVTLSKNKNYNHVSVKYLQKYLKALGYEVSVTGLFNNATFMAIYAFQKKHKLSQDGIVGTNTWRKLLS